MTSSKFLDFWTPHCHNHATSVAFVCLSMIPPLCGRHKWKPLGRNISASHSRNLSGMFLRYSVICPGWFSQKGTEQEWYVLPKLALIPIIFAGTSSYTTGMSKVFTCQTARIMPPLAVPHMDMSEKCVIKPPSNEWPRQLPLSSISWNSYLVTSRSLLTNLG